MAATDVKRPPNTIIFLLLICARYFFCMNCLFQISICLFSASVNRCSPLSAILYGYLYTLLRWPPEHTVGLGKALHQDEAFA